MTKSTIDKNERKHNDPRHQARQLALQCLHQFDVQEGANFNQLDTFLTDMETSLEVRRMARQWIAGTWDSRQYIDSIIQGVSRNWNIKRISVVDRSNLRLATHQMLDCPDIPPRVVINEAIELAKIFSSHDAPKFINGVLDAILQKLRQQSEPEKQEV